MPRPNRGPRIRFMARRGAFYIVWFNRGKEFLRSTGTNNEAVALEMLGKFKVDPVAFEHARLDLGYSQERQAMRQVYFIGGNVGGVKIGVAVDPIERLKVLQTGSPVPLNILASTDGGRELETEYHRQFADYRMHGEWFAMVGPVLAEITRLQRAA